MKNLSLLLDIGTTTIKGLLLDKAARKEVSSDFVLNEQAKFGEDIVSRIDYSHKSPEHEGALRQAALKSINEHRNAPSVFRPSCRVSG